jgi:outer membrane cobalamin receptor
MEFSSENVILTPAGRWDFSRTEYVGWENSEDNKASWSLTAACKLPSLEEKISLKGNVGTAYHSPGFDDLFWSGGSFAEGNPDLQPEESFNWDAGLYLTPLTGLEISTVYFQSYTDNLIQWLPTAGGTWRPSNIGRAEGFGLENSLSWLIPLKEEDLLFLELSGSYSWMNMIEKTVNSVNLGNQLPYRPLHSASSSCSISKNSHSLTLSGRYMGQRFTNMANTKDLDPVLTFDAVLKLVFDSGFYSSFSLLNMGDIQYIDKLGYPIPGREWSLKGGYRF